MIRHAIMWPVLGWLLTAIAPTYGQSSGTPPDSALIVNNTPTAVVFLIGNEPITLEPGAGRWSRCVDGLVVTMKTAVSVVSWRLQCGMAYHFVYDGGTSQYLLAPFQPVKP